MKQKAFELLKALRKNIVRSTSYIFVNHKHCYYQVENRIKSPRQEIKILKRITEVRYYRIDSLSVVSSQLTV